ncbi:MAG: hypothetical protein M1831_001091 [Alyxoria varia]|nr:MAG: hypothetical protein M1831_001091 [Alyxoria varia]
MSFAFTVLAFCALFAQQVVSRPETNPAYTQGNDQDSFALGPQPVPALVPPSRLVKRQLPQVSSTSTPIIVAEYIPEERPRQIIDRSRMRRSSRERSRPGSREIRWGRMIPARASRKKEPLGLYWFDESTPDDEHVPSADPAGLVPFGDWDVLGELHEKLLKVMSPLVDQGDWIYQKGAEQGDHAFLIESGAYVMGCIWWNIRGESWINRENARAPLETAVFAVDDFRLSPDEILRAQNLDSRLLRGWLEKRLKPAHTSRTYRFSGAVTDSSGVFGFSYRVLRKGDKQFEHYIMPDPRQAVVGCRAEGAADLNHAANQ